MAKALDKRTLRVVAERALHEWELRNARLELISISENTVFRVDTDAGETYALRIHRPGYHNLEELNSEQQGTYSLIHADLHPHNLLVDGDQLYVIDFDDSGFGWHQYELAVALFSYQSKPDFDAVRDALIAGYRSERALSDPAIELLPMFLLIRTLAMLGWIHERPEHHSSERLRRLIRLACAQAEELQI